MSLHETEMTVWYWKQRGGTLVEEFLAVPRSPGVGQRLIDGLIILGEETERVSRGRPRFIDIAGRDVVAVQTKNSRLGMYLMGQTLFTARLLEAFKPRSIESIALCSADDERLRPLLEAHGCKVVVCPPEICLQSRQSTRRMGRKVNLPRGKF
jgi:hypothetical protein